MIRNEAFYKTITPAEFFKSGCPACHDKSLASTIKSFTMHPTDKKTSRRCKVATCRKIFIVEKA